MRWKVLEVNAVFEILIIVHILICFGLVIVVLMQSAKGEGLAGAFGGGGLSGAVFGGRGAASFLSKATTILAVLFMVSCLTLSLMSSGKGSASGVGSGSSITEAAQQDIQQQQEAYRQQQAAQADSAAGTVENIFDTPSEEQPADSQ
ncbi:MAG: preprotein translocase subunit SecG [candidate division Zixibacteria bacterium]|nr:preprotein translocase subunit SecG [candidate division Zixibacteria bacterium]